MDATNEEDYFNVSLFQLVLFLFILFPSALLKLYCGTIFDGT